MGTVLFKAHFVCVWYPKSIKAKKPLIWGRPQTDWAHEWKGRHVFLSVFIHVLSFIFSYVCLFFVIFLTVISLFRLIHQPSLTLLLLSYVDRVSLEPSGWKHFNHILIHLFADVNECEVYKKDSGLLCAHMCVNIPGSYRCSCPSGYKLLADGRSCEGNWHLCLFLCTQILISKRKIIGDAWWV